MNTNHLATGSRLHSLAKYVEKQDTKTIVSRSALFVRSIIPSDLQLHVLRDARTLGVTHIQIPFNPLKPELI
jgi:hypothetical protein